MQTIARNIAGEILLWAMRIAHTCNDCIRRDCDWARVCVWFFARVLFIVCGIEFKNIPREQKPINTRSRY